ncbi:MAG: hypothetical protein RL481_1704 [Pseudomonadota bacterium]|jgi:hypothetical protein
MPESAQSIFILILTMPGFLGYLAYSKIYRLKVEDNIEKIGYIVGFNVFSLFFSSLFFDINTFLSADFDNLGASDVVGYVNGLFFACSACSIIVGVLLAIVLNNGKIQKFLTARRITPKTGHASVLADVIASHPDAYFKIRFKSGGHVTGFPRKYSLDGGETMIFLSKAVRRPPKSPNGDKQPPEYEIQGPGILMTNFDDVTCIEVVKGN